MGLINRIKTAMSNRVVAKVSLMTEHGNNFYVWHGSTYQSDVVRACIRPMVKQVGKLVGKHIRESIDEAGKRTIATNPAFYMRMLLEQPNPLMSGQMLLEKVATQYALNNNAFILISRNADGMPYELYPIMATNAEAVYINKELHIRFQMKNGKTFVFPYTDLIHLRNDYFDNDIFGTSNAKALTPLLDVVTITDQSIIQAIKNSSIVKWLLKFNNAIRPEDLKKQAKDFATNFLDSADGVGVAAVDSKADAQQINPTDYVPNASIMDRTTQRIYALFNTNQAIVTSTANEEQRNTYFDSVIEPVLIQLGNEYTRKLFTRREIAFGNKIVFEAAAWDTASFATKLNLVQLVDRGALTPNEWRAAFNLAPIAGGDEPIRRLDTAVVSDGTKEGGNE